MQWNVISIQEFLYKILDARLDIRFETDIREKYEDPQKNIQTGIFSRLLFITLMDEQSQKFRNKYKSWQLGQINKNKPK